MSTQTEERPETLTEAGGASIPPGTTITGNKIVMPPEPKQRGIAYWIGFVLAALIVAAAFLFIVTLIVALIAAIGALL